LWTRLGTGEDGLKQGCQLYKLLCSIPNPMEAHLGYDHGEPVVALMHIGWAIKTGLLWLKSGVIGQSWPINNLRRKWVLFGGGLSVSSLIAMNGVNVGIAGANSCQFQPLFRQWGEDDQGTSLDVFWHGHLSTQV